MPSSGPTIKLAATKRVALTLGLVVSLLLALALQPADARYLPTRADETDVEVLKDIIRGLVMQSNLDQLEARPMDKIRAQARFNAIDNSYHQVDRRAELPVVSDGDTIFGETNPPKSR